MSEFQSIKIPLPRVIHQMFAVNKVKNTVPWTYLIVDLNGENLWAVFMRKSCRRLIRKNLELKKC